MPELPEVETVVRLIRAPLIGRRITRCRFTIPRQLQPSTPRAVSRSLKGRRVEDVRRRGKYVIIDLDCGTLLVHLRMTGRLYVRKSEPRPAKHERAVLLLDDGRELVLRDPRTLGTFRYYRPEETIGNVDRLGWEPLSKEVTAGMLRERLRSRRIAIKPLLLDQSVWAGIGNIYASEALWLAEIHPEKRSNLLNTDQCSRLAESIPAVLSRALEKGGTTLRDFMSPDGKKGEYQKEFRVYGREGEPCLRCGAPVLKIQQAQRSTYFCRRCQRKR